MSAASIFSRECSITEADSTPKGKASRQGRRKMDKWDYLTVYVSDDEWFDGDGNTGTLPKYIEKFTVANPQDVLKALGSDGWELSGVASGGNTAHYQLFLKRPKKD
jgi:hypothetical protein